MTHHAKVLSAMALWIVAVTLMIDASIEGLPTMRSWALLAALMAMGPSLWLIFDYNRNRLRDEFLTALDQERGHTERLIQAVACEFAKAELSHLDSRRTV